MEQSRSNFYVKNGNCGDLLKTLFFKERLPLQCARTNQG